MLRARDIQPTRPLPKWFDELFGQSVEINGQLWFVVGMDQNDNPVLESTDEQRFSIGEFNLRALMNTHFI